MDYNTSFGGELKEYTLNVANSKKFLTLISKFNKKSLVKTFAFN